MTWTPPVGEVPAIIHVVDAAVRHSEELPSRQELQQRQCLFKGSNDIEKAETAETAVRLFDVLEEPNCRFSAFSNSMLSLQFLSLLRFLPLW
jgi:hypothetical protein